jgi:hypothetical protein
VPPGSNERIDKGRQSLLGHGRTGPKKNAHAEGYPRDCAGHPADSVARPD